MVLCAAFGCNSLSGREKVIFFRFPKDKKLRKVWCNKIGRANSASKYKVYSPNKNSRLCSLHFEEDQFTHSASFLETICFKATFRRTLKTDAVPTIFSVTAGKRLEIQQKKGTLQKFCLKKKKKSRIYKKLEAAGKKKGCEKVKAWSRSVSNHLYWCVASSDGDGEMVKQKWLSMLNHVADIHEGHGDKFPRCEHGNLEDRLWMKKGFKPHAELAKVVENKLLLKDIQKLSPAQQTSDIEAFHKVMCSWAPKSVHYMYTYMESRSKVSALHFNENARRDTRTTKSGVQQYTISYPKSRKGEPVVKDVKTEQTFGYITDLMMYAKELRLRNTYRLASEKKRNQRKTITIGTEYPKKT